MSESEFERGVHAEIARLARNIHNDVTSDELLTEVTETSVRLLPHVDYAGVTLVDAKHRRLQSTAATGPVPNGLDRLQEQHQQGPCLDAIWQHHTVRVDDYTTETRWPDFVAAVLEGTDVKSSLSIQLYTNKSELGALNLYSEIRDTFTPHIEELALAMAAHAAIGLSSTRRGDQFQSALASRDIIGQAKGIIMERFNVSAVAAFKLLIKLSQKRNTPIHDLATQLVQKDHPPDIRETNGAPS
jgi:transcriptional regulator with GAF, ATPase, and Fis domain